MAKIRIAVNHLCNDMIIGEDVYNKSGVVLVAQGSTVTDEVISLLSRHLIDSVAIEYQAAADEPQQAENVQPLVDEKQYQEFQYMHIPLMYPYYARFWQNGPDVHRRKLKM